MRLQKIARLVSTVLCSTSVSGPTVSRTMSQRRTMLRSPRTTSIAKMAKMREPTIPYCRAISENANAEAPTRIVKIQKMITAGSTHYTDSGFGPLFGGEARGRAGEDLHADREGGLVDSESR